MAVREIKLIGKYIVEARLEALTGLHIGTSKDTMKIGDVDNPVIRDANGIPYIPGSSLKGKMRALMEFFHGKLKPDGMVYAKYPDIRLHMCDEKDCPVCGLFGRNHGNHNVVLKNERKEFKNISPTRLIVRDAKLVLDSITEEMRENMGEDYTEIKFENNLDRITSEANPRQTERVPAGAKFNVSMVVNRYAVAYDDDPSAVDDGIKYLKELLIAMQLLEDDYLGGQGSRGYGKVKFEEIKITYKDIGAYEGKKDPVMKNYSSVEDAIKRVEEDFKTV
ncbi:type III-A CRISPR-associated RAMP protein Csm3 [Fervidobacterium thailandense]|uniref:CRISPR system Cms endoribonuclease Csm3 n=1 Tax=Fervidobacterium thailandense TaxID=1008305 RepID=A0A1E3G092_9BACT|nr:type III-A CRISPR-associated RAMP protein Csm3 [Fervidobacterium thailandense]ODN29661.1 type III-A CRISPR-associated RAMP protein Csm3 [Fervidobacterium thailandense]